MLIIFRVDSSNDIGGGHLTRCINIANQLKKRKVHTFFKCAEHRDGHPEGKAGLEKM